MNDLLKETGGGSSSTRLMFIIGLAWAMISSSLFTYIMEWSSTEFISTFIGTSGVFVGLKLGQKPMEKNKK